MGKTIRLIWVNFSSKKCHLLNHSVVILTQFRIQKNVIANYVPDIKHPWSLIFKYFISTVHLGCRTRASLLSLLTLVVSYYDLNNISRKFLLINVILKKTVVQWISPPPRKPGVAD